MKRIIASKSSKKRFQKQSGRDKGSDIWSHGYCKVCDNMINDFTQEFCVKVCRLESEFQKKKKTKKANQYERNLHCLFRRRYHHCPINKWVYCTSFVGLLIYNSPLYTSRKFELHFEIPQNEGLNHEKRRCNHPFLYGDKLK